MEAAAGKSTPSKEKISNQDKNKNSSNRKSQNNKNRNNSNKRKNESAFNCVVCLKSFDNIMKKECIKCSNITCGMCSKFDEILNGDICNDCEFVDQLQEKKKRKDDKKDWLKSAAGFLSNIGSKTQKQQSALVTYVDPIASATPSKASKHGSSLEEGQSQTEEAQANANASSSKKPSLLSRKSSFSAQSSKIKRKGSQIFSRNFFSRNQKESSSEQDLSQPNGSSAHNNIDDEEQLTDVEAEEETPVITDKVEDVKIEQANEIEILQKENKELKLKVANLEITLFTTQEKLNISENSKEALLKRNNELEEALSKINSSTSEISNSKTVLNVENVQAELSTISPSPESVDQSVPEIQSATATETISSGEPESEPSAIGERQTNPAEEDVVDNQKKDSSLIPTPPPLPENLKICQKQQDAVVLSVAVESTIPIPPPLPKLAKSLIRLPNMKVANPASEEQGPESSTSTESYKREASSNSSAEGNHQDTSKESHSDNQKANQTEKKQLSATERTAQGKNSKYSRKESVRQLIQKKTSSTKNLDTDSKEEAAKPSQKVELRPVFWNIIPGNRVEGTLWDEIGSNIDDIIKDDVVEHFLTLEEKFAKPKVTITLPQNGNCERNSSETNQHESGNDKNNSSQSSSSASKPLAIQRTATMSNPAKPKLLDATRAQNIQIALGRTLIKDNAAIKRLREAIIKLDRSFLTSDVVTQLLNYIPTPEEVKRIEHLLKENANDETYFAGLSSVDEFAVQMSTIPRLRQRLQCLFVEGSFESQSKALVEAVSDYEVACKTLKESRNWKQLLKLILVCGNYLNDGNAARAGAWGFELTTGLPKLGDVKAGSKYSLLHWIAETASERFPEVFTLSQELAILDKVEKIKIDDLKFELLSLAKGVQLMKREVEACEQLASNSEQSIEGSEEFAAGLGPFCKNVAVPMIDDLNTRLTALESNAKDVVVFHGEKDSVVTSQKLFEVIMTFCKSLEKIHSDILLEKKSQVAAASQAQVAKNEDASDSDRSNVAKSLETEMSKNQLSQKIKNGEVKNAFGFGHGINLKDIQSQLSKLSKTGESTAQPKE